jgi:hypothetical protein
VCEEKSLARQAKQWVFYEVEILAKGLVRNGLLKPRAPPGRGQLRKVEISALALTQRNAAERAPYRFRAVTI